MIEQFDRADRGLIEGFTETVMGLEEKVPTEQPDELEAIRARVEEIVKSLDGINHNPKYFNDYVSKYQGAVRALAGFSRRLLELLDERGHAYDAGLIDGAVSMNDSLEILAARNESLRRELAEAREKALEEAATLIEGRIKDWGTDGDLIRGYKNHAEGFIKAIRSLKLQPNQKDTQ